VARAGGPLAPRGSPAGVGGRLGLAGLLERLRAGGSVADVGTDKPVILMKKDGRTYERQSAGDLDHETSKAIRSVQGIFTAIEMDATDIHLEPKVGDEFTVRYRVDGIMQSIATLPARRAGAVVALEGARRHGHRGAPPAAGRHVCSRVRGHEVSTFGRPRGRRTSARRWRCVC